MDKKAVATITEVIQDIANNESKIVAKIAKLEESNAETHHKVENIKNDMNKLSVKIDDLKIVMLDVLDRIRIMDARERNMNIRRGVPFGFTPENSRVRRR